jgi:phosphonoacetaldehyde hydrolase
VGLSEEELNRLPPKDQEKRVQAAIAELYQCGAHVVVETIADLPGALSQITERLKAWERP